MKLLKLSYNKEGFSWLLVHGKFTRRRRSTLVMVRLLLERASSRCNCTDHRLPLPFWFYQRDRQTLRFLVRFRLSVVTPLMVVTWAQPLLIGQLGRRRSSTSSLIPQRVWCSRLRALT